MVPRWGPGRAPRVVAEPESYCCCGDPHHAPRPDDLATEGAAALKGAVVPVILVYTSADPLG
jgi:hypothetical protein